MEYYEGLTCDRFFKMIKIHNEAVERLRKENQ